MSLHLLKVQKRENRRLGRGIGSGVGKTGGRGVKGQNRYHGLDDDFHVLHLQQVQAHLNAESWLIPLH